MIKDILKSVDGKKTKIGVLIMLLWSLANGLSPKLQTVNIVNLPLEDFLLYVTGIIGLGHEIIKDSKNWRLIIYLKERIHKLISKTNG